jgi:hypothetical protein
MKRFETSQNWSSTTFLRTVGITREQFFMVRDKLLAYIHAEQEAHPMKKRGKKAVTLTIEDKLLLTLTYLRHYPTFEQLGQQFGICESYAHKVYQLYVDRLVKMLKLPGRKALLDQGVGAILIDVTEQPIERPTRQQGAYYSGKKTPYDQSPTDRGPVHAPDSGGGLRQRPDA